MKRSSALCLISAGVVIFLLILTSASFALTGVYKKRYTLTGDIYLKYERHWGDDVDEYDEFQHSYNLGFTGFYHDPRILHYAINTTFTQSIRDSDSVTSAGISLAAVFLSGATYKGKGWIKYLPSPIGLRFSYLDTGDTSTYTYGISLAYRRPGRFKLFYKGKAFYFLDQYPGQNYNYNLRYNLNRLNNLNNLSNQNNNANLGLPGVPFPEFFLDYDVSESKTDGYTNKNTFLNFRSELIRDSYEYLFNYEHETRDLSGSSSFTRDRFVFDANYKYYDIMTKRRFDIYNRASYSDSEGQDVFRFTNNTTWSKPIGTNNYDRLTFTGVFTYISADDTGYSLSLASQYAKRFSPRLDNTVRATVGFSDNANKTSHAESISNYLTYRLSRIVSIQNDLSLGMTDEGTAYGAGLSIDVDTRISLTAGYHIGVADVEEGERTFHRFHLNASGPLWRRVSFSSYALYTMSDIPSKIEDYSEDTMTIGGNLTYSTIRSRFTLGGSYSETTRENGLSRKSEVTTLTASFRRWLARRLVFTVSAQWTDRNDGATTLEVRPRLIWRYRRIFVHVEYDYIKTDNSHESTRHRFFVSVRRNFGVAF